MLELGQLVPHLDAMSRESARATRARQDQMDAALAIARADSGKWDAHCSRLETMRAPFLYAMPLYPAETVAFSLDAPPAPPTYSAIATDGSQIPLDRHAAAPYFVINIGQIAIHYGTGERARLVSNAQLFYHEADVLMGGSNGEQSYVGDRQIANRRTKHETKDLESLIKEFESRDTVLAMVDGTLILWTQEAEKDAARDEAVKDMVALIDSAQRCNTSLVGYLSKPGGREVVNTLKMSLCPADVVDTAQCRLSDHPCNALNRLTDAALFEHLLAPGQRSTVFASRSKILEQYVKAATTESYDNPENFGIGFYYVNTGKEIARVELPLLIARNPGAVNLTHALVLDQIAKGHGYPVVLHEAHEQAIVRGPERAAMNELVERALVRNGMPVLTTRKALAKQTRIL